ncbi:unnamed protein product [Xylocopa violacea]|uniref:Odorant receptor n=1 Tax=Xylocopa violacea TaxID=135666 RepID=A0ABP1N9C4_XYLVO
MNNNYENDVHSSLKYCRMFLKLIGIWHLINGFNNRLEKLVSLLIMFVCLISLIFVVLPGAYYCFFHVKEITVKIQIFGPICYGTSCTLKYCFLSLRASAFKHCIKQIEEDWKVIQTREHRAIMIDNVIIAHKSTIVFSVQLYIFGMSYCTILPFCSDPFQLADNFTIKPLIYPGLDLFMDVYASPTYEFVYIMHCLYAFFSVSIETAFCGVVASFVAHACGMLQIQMARLDYLVVERKSKRVDGESLLAVIVNGHMGALQYIKNVSKALQEIYFFDIVATTIVICVLEYLCTVAWKNRDVVAIGTYVGTWLSLTFNLLVICYAGELLAEEGEKFGDATYDIQWYNLPKKTGEDLILLIAVSKLPPKLTGGKIFEISMNTFSTVLKSSVVYLNLCQAVTQ